MNELHPIGLYPNVLRALFVYEQQQLDPRPAYYRIKNWPEKQGVIIELCDENGNILAEYGIPETGKTKFVNLAGKKRIKSRNR